ncbi:hypothetical protein Tco_0497831 [Tanacetum coccineum]
MDAQAHERENMSYSYRHEEIDGVSVTFGGNPKGGKIIGKWKAAKEPLKAFRVSNSRTRIVEENLHIRFSQSTPNVVEQTMVMYGIKASDNACKARKETELVKDYILLPLWTADPSFSQDPKSSHDDGSKPSSKYRQDVIAELRKVVKVMMQRRKIMYNKQLTMLMMPAQ